MVTSAPIGILICTRNRGRGLKATLDSIVNAAESSPADIHVVIVDNGSTDATPEVVREWSECQSFRVTTLVEPLPGLARSRNTGLAAVNSSIICMTDDDCVLDRNFFGKVNEAFSDESGPAIIGGRIDLGDEEDLPITIKTSQLAETLGEDEFPGGFIMGANLAFNAEALTMIGEFDERFGAGARFVAAEDTDFLYRAQLLRIPVRYNPGFAVKHFHGRRHDRQAADLSRGYNFGDGAFFAKYFRTDPRVRQALLQNVRWSIAEIRRPGDLKFGIKRFATFKLHHRIRGMIAYWRQSNL